MGKQKQNEFRFTLQFNEHDPHHKVCVGILNQQGKSISNFIAAAVLHYVDCGLHPISSILTEQQMEQAVERIVKMAISEYKASEQQDSPRQPQGQMPAAPVPQPRRPAPPPPEPDGLDKDSLDLLNDGMGAFR